MIDSHFKKYLLLIQCIIFYNQFNIVIALIGHSVRLAEENEFPAVVSIARMINLDPLGIENFHRCTGSLVSKQDVLTAEHCIRNIFVEPFKILVGSNDLQNAMEFLPMYVWAYQQWALFRHRNIAYGEHDIAIIKLIGNVPGHIEFAPIGNLENSLLYGLDVVTAGWGQLTNGSMPRLLHTTPLKVLTKDDCENRVFEAEGVHIPINEKEICTVGDPLAMLNTGDSGGPILFFGVVVGINNGVCPPVQGVLHTYHVNIHLNIRHYTEFVQDMLSSFHMNF